MINVESRYLKVDSLKILGSLASNQLNKTQNYSTQFMKEKEEELYDLLHCMSFENLLNRLVLHSSLPEVFTHFTG